LIGMKWIRRNSRGRWAMAGAMLVTLGLVGIVPWRVTAQATPAGPAKVPWPGFYAVDQPDERAGQDLVRLNRPSVRADLKLTADQLARVDAAMAALRREQARILQSMRQPEWDKLVPSVKQAHQQVAAILTPGQMDRLRQIHLQYTGAFALQEDDIAVELRLTPEQRQQIQRIYKEHIRSVTVRSPRVQDPKAERAELRRFRQVYQRNQRRTLALLTHEQRDQFLQMLGPPLPNLEDTLLFRLRKS